MLGEDPTFGINGRFSSPKKKFSIKFSKANTNFSLILQYNADNSYLFVNGEEITKFKADNKNVNNGFSATWFRELSLNGSVYDFSFDYNSIDKSDTLNIRKYLMTKNNIK